MGRVGQWSLRLPCAAQGRPASRGRLSSEGLDRTCSADAPLGRPRSHDIHRAAPPQRRRCSHAPDSASRSAPTPQARAVPRRCRSRPCSLAGRRGAPPVPQPTLQSGGAPWRRALNFSGPFPEPWSLSFFLRPIEERVCGETATSLAVSFRVGSRFVPRPLKTGCSAVGTCSTISSRSETWACPWLLCSPRSARSTNTSVHASSFGSAATGKTPAFSGVPSSAAGTLCGLTFELRRPSRWGALARQQTIAMPG